MKKVCQLFIVLCLGITVTYAQTWPTPFALSTGTYSFTAWASTSPDGTYPANMRFYTLNTTDPPESATITADYVGSYSLTSGTRINGEDANGVSFINTGSGQLGAAVVALNTTGRKTITVAWTGRTILANIRIYDIQLYYRVGDTGAWTTLPSQYTTGTDGTSMSLPITTLGTDADNKPIVQLQWKYFQDAASATSGARAKLAIDDITVTSQINTAAPPPVLSLTPTTLSSFSAITGSPSAVQSFTLSGTNLTGNVSVVAPVSFEVSTSPGSGFSNSVSLASTAGTLAAIPIYIRFLPTVSGQIMGTVSITSTGATSKAIAVAGTTVTWPTAFALSSGTYSFTAWAPTSPAGTYPANMRFYSLNNTSDTNPSDVIGEDYTYVYNATSQTRINGQDANGFSFINTSSSANSSPINSYKLGASIVALNTQGRTNIAVSWTGFTYLTNNQAYMIRLSYRVGNTGPWTDILNGGNPVQYTTATGVTSATAPASTTIASATLPVAANNQSLVQVMWKYTLDPNAVAATGARAQLGVDDIKITSVAAPMPVTWVTGARKNGKTATIFWTTYTETHSRSFTVQRSTNAIDFTSLTEIASQASAGNSTDELTYQYVDESPLSGTNYYRIAQHDLDGTTNYSRIYGLEFDRVLSELSVYPNPASSILNVSVDNTKIKEVRLLDINGRLLSTKTVNDYVTTLDVQPLAQQVFYTQIVLENGEKLTKKVVKN